MVAACQPDTVRTFTDLPADIQVQIVHWEQQARVRQPGALTKVDEGAVGRAKAEPLRRWFNRGAEGKIPWGSKGDFDDCVAVATGEAHMTPERAKGYCNLRHKDVLGVYPGQEHGKAEHPDDPKKSPERDYHVEPDYDPQELGVEHLGTTTVDPQIPQVDRQHYQHDLNMTWVVKCEEMKRKHLAARMGLLARREDGSLWIIDGQHHTLAAIGRGIPQLRYRVFDSSGPAQEKQVFAAWQAWQAQQREDK